MSSTYVLTDQQIDEIALVIDDDAPVYVPALIANLRAARALVSRRMEARR
jgi:hypothetical protein